MDWSPATASLIRMAVEEDLGPRGDVTSALLAEPDANAFAHVVPRRDGVICGLALAPLICEAFSKRLGRVVSFTPWRREGGRSSAGPSGRVRDGDVVHAHAVVGELQGPRAAVLATERTLLNFLCRMSGVATLTRRYVDAARGGNPNVVILDTRKTIPAWRELDKYSVRCGGAESHRAGLFDAVLIKDNHLSGVPTERWAATLFEMLNRLAPGPTPPSDDASGLAATGPRFVEVEVDSLEQLREVFKVVGIDAVLLDNFPPEVMRAAVKLRDESGLRGKVALEASGGITLENVAKVAATGVDRISVGALTHSAPALDIGLDFVA